MIQIMSSNGEVQYGVNDYVIDFDSELDQIVRAEAGSTAYSIESGTTFIKDNFNKWNVFTNNSGGGGVTPELPDNIIQTYEMELEEFWDNYNAGNLGTGLYEVVIEDGLIATSLPIDYKLNYGGQGIVTNDNYGWVLSYEDLTLLQINDKGEVVKVKKLTDLVSDRKIVCKSGQSNIIIDGSNYLYIGSANEEVLAVNIDDIENFNNWNIINPNITSSQNIDDCWNFSIISSYCDSTDFLVLDGGTFAYRDNDPSKIAYFKNGNLITQIENIPYPALSREDLMVSNYITNKFYRIYFEGDYNTYTGFFKLYEFNIDGTYTSYTLNNTFTFNESDINNFVPDNRQMFIRNDILYIQFIINNTLYLFLFDTVTNSVIQEEQIYSPTEGDQVWYYNQSKYNDLYHDLDFSVSCLRYGGMNELTGNNFDYQPFFIKITYKDEASYAELLHLNDFNINDFETRSQDNIFHYRCNKNGQYLYAGSDNKFHLFSFKDCTDITLPNSSDILNFKNRQLYSNINDSADFIITAYDLASYDIGFIRIDAITGNIISSLYEQSSAPNENIRLYIKDKNVVLYGDLVINSDTLRNDYFIDSGILGKPLTQLNGKQLFYTENSINHLEEGKISMSQLVHKNNIILTKTLKEK